jgi:cell division GTPase FtsZ
MNRREAIKGIAALGAGAFLLNKLTLSNAESKSIHFIGIGGAGSNGVEFLHKKGIQAKYTCISNPVRENLPSAINFIHFIPPGEKYSEMKPPAEVLEIFDRDDQFVLLAGLGGYTGTYMTEQLTHFLQAKKKSFMTICSLPFHFEGQKKRERSEQMLHKLQSSANFFSFDLQDIKKRYGNMKLNIAFERADEQFYEIFKTNLAA